MSFFNRFIAVFSLFAVMAFGFLAVQSTQVDFMRIDRELGLLDKKVPSGTLSTKAQLAVGVVANPHRDLENVLQNSIAASIQAVIAQVRAFLANLKNILNNVIDIINEFISALKYVGQSLSMFKNFASIATMAADGRFDQAIRSSLGIAQEISRIPANFQSRVENIKDSWAQLVSAEKAMRDGMGAQADLSQSDINQAKTNLFTEVANAREEISDSSSGASANTGSGASATNSASNATGGNSGSNSLISIPVNNLLGCTGEDSYSCVQRYAATSTAAAFAASVDQADATANSIQQQIDQGKAAPDCPTYLGRKSSESGGSIVPIPTAKGDEGSIEAIPNAKGGGSIVPIPNAGPFLKNVGRSLTQVEPSSLDQSQCELAKSKVKVITDLDRDTGEPNEFSSTVSAIVEIVTEIQALIQDVKDIINQVQEIISLVKSAVNTFTDFGKVFSGIGGGGSGSSSSNIDRIGSKTVDDGSVLVDAGPFLTDSALFDQYANQSGDCILDSVKSKSNNYTNDYLIAGGNLRTGENQRPSLNSDNSKSKTNGTNVYDAVLGASVRGGNTPGIKVKKTSDTEVKLLKPNQEGETKTTPARSLISQSRAKGNANVTYHTCQESPWDNNDPNVAAQRMAYYTNIDEHHQAYHDGLSNEWRVVNNNYAKQVPQECFIWRNSSREDLLRVAREIGVYSGVIGTEEAAINQAKTAIENAQRDGRVRWNPDAKPGQPYASGGIVFKVGDNAKNVDLPNGPCEQNYNQDQIDAALRQQGWNIGTAEIKSFVDFVK